MGVWENYHMPRSVDEAIRVLGQYNGNARIIAGGTDLMIDLQHGDKEDRTPLGALVDVTQIDEMTHIYEQDRWITVGAAVTHTAIVKSALLETKATCLVESCGVVGGPQVRNVGTLGGNVAHALPAGDGTTSLVALDAEALVAWNDGRREWKPIIQLFKGPGQSALDSSRDVLVAFRFAASREGEGTAFKRIMRPQGVALPILGCALWVKLDDSRSRYASVRACIGPLGSTPIRLTEVEQSLMGQSADEAALERVIEVAERSLHPRTSKYRATAEYRGYMIETLLRKALPLALHRAQTGQSQAEGVGMG